MMLMKKLGLLVLAAIAVSAFSGSATASVFTSPAGTAYTGMVEESPERVMGHFVFDTAFNGVTTECDTEALAFRSIIHGSTLTGIGEVKGFKLENCTKSKVITLLERGSLEFHATGNGNATVTSTGMEFTSNTATPIEGTHCKYKTKNTHIGTFTGSKTTGARAVIHLAGASIPRVETSSVFCGNLEVTSGSFEFNSPAYLDIS